jgi:branched-subunit amino acid aminotransferase/4-amino-4-deoxychorismate lyase
MLEQALRETIRIQDRRVPLLVRHLARLESGGCDAETLGRVRAAATAAASKWEQPYGRMSLTVARDGTIEIEISDQPSSIAVDGGPVMVAVRSDEPPLPPGAAKPADRSFWDRALERAKTRGGDIAVLIDSQGRIIDGSQASVWLVLGEELVTPPSPPALAGVSRLLVMDSAELWGVRASERELHESDILLAQEVFFTTAVGGAASARDHEGPVAARVHEHFERIFSAGDDDS